MIVIDNPNTVFFDVDETLILWNPAVAEDSYEYVTINTPWGTSEYLPKNEYALKRLLVHHTQRHFIVVWSQGGHDWAEAVVKALGIESFVDLVMTKPKWLVDDLPPSEWTKHVLPWKETK